MVWQISPVIIAIMAGIATMTHVALFVKVRSPFCIAKTMAWGGMCASYVFITFSSNIVQSPTDISRALARCFIFLIAFIDVLDFVLRVIYEEDKSHYVTR